MTRPIRAIVHLLLLSWFTLPLLPLVLWAAAATWSSSSPLPQEWGLRGFTAVLQDGAGPAFARSLALGCAVAALATPAGATAARALRLGRVRRPRLVSALLLAPVALPAFAVVMGLEVVLLRLHVPAYLGMVLVLTVAALPYTTYLMRMAYLAYDFGYEDEARTLGASRRTVWWRVRLPLLGPGIAAATFLAFLVGWSDYVVTLLVGGGRLVTLPVLVASAASGTGNEPTVAALSLFALAPPILALALTALLRRRLSPRRSRAERPPATAGQPLPIRLTLTQGAV
jgi:putative spermidine/putrescine transport system permease protein